MWCNEWLALDNDKFAAKSVAESGLRSCSAFSKVTVYLDFF